MDEKRITQVFLYYREKMVLQKAYYNSQNNRLSQME